jgi:hypothetical protein
MSAISTDRAWFKKNPNANCRLRLPSPGEVETIMRRSHGAELAHEIVARGGDANCFNEDSRWMVLVVSIDRDTIIKMLTVQPISRPIGPPENDWTFNSVALMNRAFIEKLGA